MIQIKTLNAISPVYGEILPEDRYAVSADIAAPDAILVRSADMHEYAPEKNLLCVARAGAGYNNIPTDAFAEQGIVAFNTPGANANAVKELAIAGLLLASRKVIDGVRWCDGLKDSGDQAGKLVEKGKSQFAGPEIAGKTLGVIGLGAVGRLVANACVSLDMKVLGHDPFISVDNAWLLSRAVEHCTDLDRLLASSDYVTIHVPLTDASRNMFNAETIAKMKTGAALLNFSRGGLVDNKAVIDALESGKLRCYVTDFPSADLIGVPGVVCIPHLGASTPESEDNCVRMASRQIRAYVETGAIINSVNYPNCSVGPVTVPRVCILHRNVPNILQNILRTVTEAGENLNIENMVNQSRNAYACTVLDFDHVPGEALLNRIADIGDIYRVRLLTPGGKA